VRKHPPLHVYGGAGFSLNSALRQPIHEARRQRSPRRELIGLRRRASAALKAPELPRTTRRRFRSIGRGHALQRIDLYPVRAQAPSSHNRYSRVPKPESAGGEPNYY